MSEQYNIIYTLARKAPSSGAVIFDQMTDGPYSDLQTALDRRAFHAKTCGFDKVHIEIYPCASR